MQGLMQLTPMGRVQLDSVEARGRRNPSAAREGGHDVINVRVGHGAWGGEE